MKGFFRTLFEFIMTPKTILLVLSVLYSSHYSVAQIATYDFAGGDGSQATNVAASSDANLTAGDMSKGSGLTTYNGYSGGFNAYEWGAAATLDANDYYEFTVTPEAGYAMTLTSLVFDDRWVDPQANDTYFWALRSSIDGYSSDIDVPIGSAVTQAGSPDFHTNLTFTLPGGTFTDLTTPVTFRLYGYDVTNPNNLELGIDNVDLNGSVSLSTDILAIYNFDGSPGSGTANASASNITPTPFRAVGVAIDQDLAPQTGTFSWQAWADQTAVDLGKYYEFSIAPDAGYEFTLTSLQFKEQREHSAQPTKWQIRSSLDNYTTIIDNGNTTDNSYTTHSIDLTGGTYDNLNSPISFRIYAYDRSSNNANREWFIDDVILSGSATAPSKTSIATIDFESVNYTLSSPSSPDGDSFWAVFAASDHGTGHTFANGPLAGTQGLKYLGYRDGNTVGTNTVVNSSSIDVSTYDNLDLVFSLAATNGVNYEDVDIILIDYQYDGGGYQNLTQWSGNSTPALMTEDSDFSAGGDGVAATQLGALFKSFTRTIPKNGSLLDIRFTVTTSNEDAIIDNIGLFGDSDVTPPEITSIVRQTPSNAVTNASSVTYRVTFNEGVLNVGTGDFVLSGTASGAISTVTPNSATEYDVLVNTITGDGNLNLDLAGGQDITDIAGVAFAGTINSEEEYTIDNTAPEVTSIIRQAPMSASTTATSVTFRVTFDEPVVNVGTADFTLSGTASGSISTVTPNSTTEYDVLVNTVSGNSDNLNLDFAGGQNVVDNVGNAFIGTINAEEEYTIDNVGPSVLTVGSVVTTGGVIVANYWNSSNSGLSITVPLDAGDATLDNGSIQIQARVDAGTFENLGATVSITNLDRTNGFKIVTIADNTPANGTADTEEITGFVEEGTLEFRAQVSDNPGNTSTYNASATLLAVDQTLPTISPDEISLISSGEITFTLSEQLNYGPGASTGFSTNDGTLSTQDYSGVGTSNTITMLGSGWSLSTSVSYTGAGNIVDLAGNSMAAVVNHPVTLNVINMSAGDAAFTYYRSDDPNEFAFVLLKDIPIGTQIKFTNNGWSETTIPPSFRTSEETLIWEADANYYAGLEVRINGTTPTVGSVTGSELTLSTDGDQIFAYQGTSINPTFIAGIHTYGTWDANNSNQQESMQPLQLITAPPSSFNIAHSDNYNYDRGVTTGSVSAILTDINNSSNWDADNNPNNITPPSGGLEEFVLPPSVDALIPANGSTVIASTTTLQIDFNENMTKGPVFGGNVTISISGGATIATIPVGSGLITINNDIVSINISGLTLNDGVTYEVDVDGFLFQNADENHNVPIDGATEWSFTADGVAPTVSSINRGTATPLNANFGTTASSVTYTVVFSEDVNPATVTTADFTTKGAASGGTETVSNVTGSGDTYTVTVSSINKLGDLTIEFNALGAGAVTDLVGNVGTTFATGDQSFYIINPEPSQQPTALLTSEGANTFTIDLSWTAGAGGQLADGYLILYKTTAGSFPADPTDLIAQGNTFDGTNGVVNSASTSISISGLASATNYDFKIYPYTNSGNQTDYKTDGTILAGSQTTGAGELSTLSLWNLSTTVSSLTNSQADAAALPVANFVVRVVDDGLNAAIDNAPTLLSEISFSPDAGNAINWVDAIEGAQLDDGTNIWNTDVNGGDITIDNTQITFSNLPTGSGQLGEILDNGTKYYNLRIWLKSAIADAVLRNTIDGMRFVFEVNATSFSYETGSSKIEGTQTASSSAYPTYNIVTVVATDLNWEAQPPATAGVQAPFTSTPVIEAVDANGNRDINYTGAVTTVTNTGTIAMNNNPDASDLALSFASGIYNFDITASTGFNYQDAGDGTLTVTSGTLNPSPASDPVAVSYSDGTTITAGPLTEEPNITPVLGNYAIIKEWIITDDALASVDDKVPTKLTQVTITAGPGTNAITNNWTEAFQDVVLSDPTTTYFTTGTVTSNSLIFNSINNVPDVNNKAIGFIPDDGTWTIRLYADMNEDFGPNLEKIIDNMNFVVSITTANVATEITGSSSIASGQSVISDDTKNFVRITATQLVFTQQPPSIIDAQVVVSPAPIVEAHDANGNLDSDFSEAVVSVTNARLPSPIPMTDEPDTGDSFSSGVLDFATVASVFSYDEPSLINGDAQLTLSTTSFTAVSDPVTVVVSQLSDIIEDGSFTYPTNGDFTYLDYDTESDYLEIARFIITDGGDGNGNDSDNAATKLNSLTLHFANFNSIREVGIYDGGSLVSAIKTLDPSGNVTFAGAELTPIVASDNGTKTFNVRVNFDQSVVDNEQFTVQISGAVADPLFSRFAAPDAGGAITTLAANDNKISVLATQLVFTTNPHPTNISTFTNIDNPYIVLEAQDVNFNTDADYTSAIGTVTTQNFSPSNPLTFNSSPSGNFTAGVYDFAVKAPTLNFTTDGLTGEMVVSAPGLTDGISTTFSVAASEDSYITYVSDGGKIPYIDFPTNADLTSANSYAIAQFQLHDGNPGLNGDEDGNGGDLDGASTVISSITISITNSGNLDKIGIFDAGGTQYGIDMTAASSVTFNSVNFVALDNQTNNFFIRASFKTTSADITDNAPIDIAITSVTSGGGSKFDDDVNNNGGEPDGSGGFITPATPSGNNKIAVIATRFDFTVSPGALEGVDIALSTSPSVRVEDTNDVLDMDYPGDYSLSTPQATLDQSNVVDNFSGDGVLDLSPLRYSSVGVGTITITGNSLDILGIPFAMTSDISSPPVTDVINTVGNQLYSGIEANDVPVVSGKQNIAILGFSLSSAFNNGSDPRFNELIINFVNPSDLVTPVDVSSTFQNFRLFQSLDNSIDPTFANTLDITATTPVLSNGNSTLTFSGFNFQIDNNLANQYYFLVVNVSVNADDQTPPVVPLIIDNDIIMSAGSFQVVSPIIGLEYEFDDRKKPEIDYPNLTPLDNSLSVELDTDFILAFDEDVTSLDGEIYLYRQDDPDGTPITLILDQSTNNSQQLLFELPFIDDDNNPVTPDVQVTLEAEVDYFINIAPGDGGNSTGIVDGSENYFGGIKNNTSWNFRGKDTTPPNWLSTDIVISNEDDDSFAFTVNINELSTVYWVLVESGSGFNVGSEDLFTIDGSEPGYISHGQFDVNVYGQNITNYLFNLSGGPNYELYVIAEDIVGNKQSQVDVSSIGGEGYLTSTVITGSSPPNSGISVVTSETSICVGESQPLLTPIFIKEESDNEFSNNQNGVELLLAIQTDINPSTGKKYNISFDDTSIPIISSESSATFDNLNYDYVSDKLLRITLDIGNAANRDYLLLNGIKFTTPNGNATGRVINVSSDPTFPNTSADIYVEINSYNSSVVASFRFEPNVTSIGNDQPPLILIPSADLLGGTNSFSGNGVYEQNSSYLFNPSIVNITSHQIQLNHIDVIGCTAIAFKTITVFDAATSITGIESQLCIDKSLPFDINNEDTYEIIGKTEQDAFIMDTLYISIDPLDIGASAIPANFDPANPSLVLEKDVATGDYILKTTVAGQFVNQNTVSLQLIGQFRSIFNSAEIIELKKIIEFSEAPKINDFFVQGASNFSFNTLDFCEDDAKIQLATQIDRDYNNPRTETIEMVQFNSSLNKYEPAADDGGSLDDNGAGAAIIDPLLIKTNLGSGQYVFRYTLKNLNTTCSNTDTLKININSKPVADFDAGTACDGNDVQFTNTSTPLVSIVENNWTFEDVASIDVNPKYTFSNTGNFNVELKVTTDVGCINNINKQVSVGGIPQTQFAYTGVNYGDTFEFTSSTVKPGTLIDDKISHFIWDFGDGTIDSVNVADGVTDSHIFTDNLDGPLIGTVKLNVVSTLGCENTLAKPIAVLDTINVLHSDRAGGDFNNGPEGWTILSSIDNSWVLSSEPGLGQSNNNMWVTGDNGTPYKPKEKSYLYSASLDISGILRPLVQLDAYWDMAQGDGAILQYSIDNLNAADPLKVWNTVGQFQSGEDWYNSNALDFPAQTSSRNSWAGINLEAQPKHVLDSIPNASRNSVNFRFLFLSDRATPANEGFAFDNFIIGERTRTVLLENFTNTSETTITKAESDYLKDFSINDTEGTVLVKINYHTDFPGNDPINTVNKVDPSARALFYDVTSTPMAIIDGMITDPEGRPFSQWGETSFNLRSLILAQYKIDLNVTTDGGAINIEAIPTPQNNSVIGKNTIMLAAVLEKDVDLGSVPSKEESAEFVLRKLLPNAAGTVLNTANASNGQPMAAVNFSWVPNNVVDLSDLAVVVIIQDEDTKEVYQSELWLDVPTPEIVTAVDEANKNLFNLYPNPASDQLHILLSPKLGQNSVLKIYDNFGKIVYEHVISETNIILDTQDFASGMYHVQVTNEKEVIRKRLIISHSDR